MYTDEELLDQVRMLTEDGVPPTIEEFQAHPETASRTTAQKRFGSWLNCLKKAGVLDGEEDTSSLRAKRFKQYTEADVVRHIRRLADGEEPPTTREFDSDSTSPSVAAARNKFGTWAKAVENAGLTPRTKIYEECSKEELINQIQSLADGDEPPTSEEFTNAEETASSSQVDSKFGSWVAGLEEAGFDTGSRKRKREYTEQEAIDWLHAYVEEFGVLPTASSLKSWPGPKHPVYYRLFGSLDEALEKAGYKPKD